MFKTGMYQLSAQSILTEYVATKVVALEATATRLDRYNRPHALVEARNCPRNGPNCYVHTYLGSGSTSKLDWNAVRPRALNGRDRTKGNNEALTHDKQQE